MPGSHAYKTDKKPYASNPHGGEHNYAGKTLLSGGMLPDIEKERKLTDEEKSIAYATAWKNYKNKKAK